MRSRFAWVVSVASVGAGLHGCSLGALSGFSGGAPEDAGPPADGEAPGADGGKAPDGTSCADVKRKRPDAPDGRYVLDPDGPGDRPPFEAYCDMTADDGGWMLVTEEMIGAETPQHVTVVRGTDENGGLIQMVYANSEGCSGTPPSVHVAIIRDVIPWRKLRARYTFRGAAACWWILGARDENLPAANIVPFTPGVDVAREAVRMGGSAGNAFDGKPSRCDNEPINFWHSVNGREPRSLVAIVRRESDISPAGLATLTGCAQVQPGAASPTSWEHREIYIR